jgi:Fur family peroxide stress response transcriptional regulator
MKRYSRQRDAVREALCSAHTHPTANDICDIVRKNIPNISLATVYRNLSELCKNGEAIMITSTDGAVRFDGFTRPHYHLYCSRCGCVVDIDARSDDDLCKIAERQGHEVESYSLIYYGVCKNCRE